ncbi:nucleotide-diphospho-sugar transferase [Lipomyces kononenkoae]|uniref:Nucleotide-diphospho-sugar transferase n=1 Tax=Lipomyces kononenkoae TaxID=34357 RepID=A0ACC3SRP6_LIPKO
MALSTLSAPIRRAIAVVGVIIFICLLVFFRDLSASSLYNGFDPPNHRKASQLAASDLLAGPLAKNHGVMPKLIHQSWSTPDLPKKFEAWSTSCREQNPDWEWVLWTDEDNLNLVKKYFPWFLEYYQKLPGEIYRADLVRNIYMYIYGGVYADLDVECLRPAAELFEDYNVTTAPHKSTLEGAHHIQSNGQPQRTAFFGRMGTDVSFEHSIPNAWMASTPGHPFFLLSLDKVVSNLKGEIAGWVTAEMLTGPIALRTYINLYLEKYKDNDELNQKLNEDPVVAVFGQQEKIKHAVEVLPWWNVFPYSWDRDGHAFRAICSVNSPDYDRERCKLNIAADRWGSYFITYWSHSWSRTGHNANNMKNIGD